VIKSRFFMSAQWTRAAAVIFPPWSGLLKELLGFGVTSLHEG
jgi:hypothetical protein